MHTSKNISFRTHHQHSEKRTKKGTDWFYEAKKQRMRQICAWKATKWNLKAVLDRYQYDWVLILNSLERRKHIPLSHVPLLPAHSYSRSICIHYERSERFISWTFRIRIRPGKHEEPISMSAIGNPHLTTINHILITHWETGVNIVEFLVYSSPTVRRNRC